MRSFFGYTICIFFTVLVTSVFFAISYAESINTIKLNFDFIAQSGTFLVGIGTVGLFVVALLGYGSWRKEYWLKVKYEILEEMLTDLHKFNLSAYSYYIRQCPSTTSPITVDRAALNNARRDFQETYPKLTTTMSKYLLLEPERENVLLVSDQQTDLGDELKNIVQELVNERGKTQDALEPFADKLQKKVIEPLRKNIEKEIGYTISLYR